MKTEDVGRRGTSGSHWLARLALVLGLAVLAACGDGNPTVDGLGQPVPTDRGGTTSTPTPGGSAEATSTTSAGGASGSGGTTATTGSAGPLVVKTAGTERFGTILVDGAGKALYVFDRDTTSAATCTGGCASTWPPLLAPTTPATPPGVSGKLAVAARSDGIGTQVTYNDKPLYRYAADANPGDVGGDGVGGVWHVAKP